MRDSGIVPAHRQKLSDARLLRPATVLSAPRADVSRFGSTIAGGGDVLLVGGRSDERKPFAAFYRMTAPGAVREHTMLGADAHAGPSLATDGVRVLVGQSRCPSGQGFAAVYRKRGRDLPSESRLEPRPGELEQAEFARHVAIGGELLVLGHSVSVSVYRHSPVGWLAAGSLQPVLPYGWNPQLGSALGVIAGRVLVGNPIEVDGHRAGPGRVFVYRQRAHGGELESVLSGEGIEFGREEPLRVGFGASVQVAGEFAVITAPHEVASDGRTYSRVYVYRAQSGTLNRVAQVTVPSCHYGACLAGDRLCVLGEQLYVFARRGHAFTEVATYDVPGAEAIAQCGELVALSHPHAERVSLHFAAQL
jgi:hypothetical protein